MAVKFTVVPSGAGVPAVVVTLAVIVDVAEVATDPGFAETATEAIATGFSNKVIMLKAPLLAEAVTFTVVSTALRLVGTTVMSTDACPKVSVVTVLPLGNVTDALSDPNVTVTPDASSPELS